MKSYIVKYIENVAWVWLFRSDPMKRQHCDRRASLLQAWINAESQAYGTV